MMAERAAGNTLWPADKVERRATAALIPYARNARTHSDAQVAQIAASITEWGWTTPVLVDADGILIAGHGRVLAAQRLGIAEVPVMVATGWTKAQIAAYRLADNKLALNAGWDNEALAIELGELSLEGFDLPLIGFGPDELAGLLDSTEGLTDPDDVPDVQPEVVTVLGDVWLLGRHRLLCGDSTNPQHVETLTQGVLADLCFTSPPYGQQRDYKNGGIADWDALMQGVFSILPVAHDAQVLVNLGLVHKNGEVAGYWDGWIAWMAETGWRKFGWYVWDQGSGFPGVFGGRCAPSHEFIFHFNRHNTVAKKTVATKDPGKASAGGQMGPAGWVTDKNRTKVVGERKIPDSVWRVNRSPGDGSHSAIFPVGLPDLACKTWPSGVMYEPFSGSGTTIIAAEQNGRTCLGMELAPQYVDVAVRRWEAFTGQQATHERTGRTFAETANSATINGPDEQSQAQPDRRTA